MSQALVVIDVQNEYVTGALPIVHPPVAESLARIGDAMDAAAAAGIPVVLVRHTEPDPSGGVFVAGSLAWELHDSVAARPHDVVVDKTLPGAFMGTGLEEWLRSRDVDSVVIVGWMTHMCVDTTTRGAMHRGFDAVLLGDATGTIDLSEDLPAELVHRVELGVLADGFARVVTTAEWVAEIS